MKFWSFSFGRNQEILSEKKENPSNLLILVD